MTRTTELGYRADTIVIQGGSLIGSAALGSGNAGRILVETDQLLIDGAAATESPTGIISTAGRGSSGDAGSVAVVTTDLRVLSRGIISSVTAGSGDTGGILVSADQITIDGAKTPEEITGITSIASPSSSGSTGAVVVRAVDLQLLNGGVITSSILSSGDAGSVEVIASRLLIDGAAAPPGFLTGIASNANDGATGDAGVVIVKAADLQLLNGGTIASATFATGNGGLVEVNADRILIDDRNS